MFCKKCGAKLGDEMSFCNRCGNKIESFSDQSLNDNEKVSPDAEVVLLKMSREYIGLIQPYLEKNEEIEDRKNKLKDHIGEYSTNIKKAILYWSLFVFSLILNIISISSHSTSSKSSDFWVKGSSSFSIFGIALCTVFIIGFAIVAIIHTVGAFQIKSRIPQYEEEIKQCDFAIISNNKTIDEIVNDKDNAVNRTLYGKIFPNGASVETIDKLINYITSHRADSIKEALRLLDDEKYKQRMLALQALQVSYAADTASYAKSTAESAQSVAENASAAAHAASDAATYSRLNLNR